MKKTPTWRWLAPLCVVFLFSCEKQTPASSPNPGTSTAQPKVKGVTKLPNGGQDGSGVDQTTGYTLLTKHIMTLADGTIVRDANGNPAWDGTYDAPWYNTLINISICRYKNNAPLGTPAFGYFTTPPGTGASVSGDCNSSFVLTLITLIVTGYYTPSSLSSYETDLNNYFNGTRNDYPVPPDALNGSAIQTRYGKLITVSSGVYALAEMGWTPPPPAPPGCNAICQICKADPNDPRCP